MRDIERWDPFRDFRRELDRLFESHFGALEPFPGRESVWNPRVNVEELPDKYLVWVEVPGIKKEDIKLSLTRNTLTLSGERKWESEHKDATLHRQEIFYGRFQRAISFPDEIDPEGAKASYKDGVLRVELAKSEKAKPKEIKVEIK